MTMQRQDRFSTSGSTDPDDLIAWIERLQREGYEPQGRWNLTQICQHLTATISGGMNGFGFRMPWLVRRTVGPWAIRRVLRTSRFPRGVPTFRVLRPPAPAGEDQPVEIARCIEVIRQAKSFRGPLPPHPMVDDLSLEDWKRLMWVHASHHLRMLRLREPTGND